WKKRFLLTTSGNHCAGCSEHSRRNRAVGIAAPIQLAVRICSWLDEPLAREDESALALLAVYPQMTQIAQIWCGYLR
ncbi:MAG: hypothetical protein KDE45_14435, partial [Caldilineaceae bacterium]|nr:hypothetical protein [Caldilineaceae bacterium]